MSKTERSAHPYLTRVSGNRPRLPHQREILQTSKSERLMEGRADRSPLFPDAYCKCGECGATIRTFLDWRLHTANSGECIARSSGQRARVDRVQQAAPDMA